MQINLSNFSHIKRNFWWKCWVASNFRKQIATEAGEQ